MSKSIRTYAPEFRRQGSWFVSDYQIRTASEVHSRLLMHLEVGETRRWLTHAAGSPSIPDNAENRTVIVAAIASEQDESNATSLSAVTARPLSVALVHLQRRWSLC